MLEVVHQDYIRTAWSKGLKEQTIIMKHALKNALIPVITMVGMGVPLRACPNNVFQ
jgi:peptide/nickel transport system permease protein